jgi:prepilin-type N-terminal cleavage/methylation domain-containing protein
MRWGVLIVKNEQGFTLIELVVVIAIIGIITAMFIPNLSNTTDKVKLKSDILSLKVINNAIDLYNAENSEPMNEITTTAVINLLVTNNYIKSSKLQTFAATLEFGNNNELFINIKNCSDKINTIANKLSQEEQEVLIKN